MSRTAERGVTMTRPESSGSLRRAVILFLPSLETACCAVLAALLLWKGILPGWRLLNTDFPNYYLVARLLREGYSLDRIYDWVWLQRIKDHWGLDQALVGFAGLTPFSALPVVPFSVFSAIVAKRLWILTNVLLLCSSVELLSRVTSLGRRRIWLLSLLAVFPLRTSFLLGQMHLLVLFLLVSAYYFHRRGRQIACGVCLGIAGVLKVYPLLLGGYFLWKRQWRPAFATLAATLLLVGMGYLWIGSDVLKIYATQILPRSVQGEVLDPYSLHAASGAALFHRFFIAEPTLNPVPLLSSPALYAVLYPLWQLAVLVPLLAVFSIRANRAGTVQLEWAAFVLALLVLSPVPASYHFVVMIFSIVLLLDVLLARKEYSVAGLAVALYCLISAIEFLPGSRTPGGLLGTVAGFARLWLLLLLYAVFLFCLWPGRAKLLKADFLRTASLLAVVAVGWTAGAFGYHRHFAYLKQEMSRRILASVSPYLASNPRPISGGYVFTAMLPNGYRVLDQNGNEVWKSDKSRSPVDQLSVAVAQNTPFLILELADGTGSRIVAIPSGPSSSKDSQEPRSVIPDAESPAISPDGKSVAFIREIKGKGTLWIARSEDSLGRFESLPNQIAGNAYDVRDVTFAPSGWLMFAAKVNGRISILRMIPGGQPKMVSSPGEDVDSPAVSSDERFVAFRKLLHNRWQLGYMDVATGHERMLTLGDCNVYSPGWTSSTRIAYATDCGRGLGLSALASVDIGKVPPSSIRP
jgi:Glycosyltransferase family 87/WD40-like Beta Propeller Repeat